MSHVHHHGHGGHGGHGRHGDHLDWEEPVGGGVRRALTVAVAALALATLVGLVVWWPRGEARVDRSAVDFGDRVSATVTEAMTGPCSFDPAEDCRTVDFRVTTGTAEGETGSIEQSADTNTPATTLDEGDDFLVTDAGPDAGPGRFQFADLERSNGLLVLAAVFAVAVVALGRLRGLLALGGIGISVGVLLVYVFPALLQGTTPLGVALTGAAVIAFGTLYLAHGVNERTTVALLGTMTSLLLTAALASFGAGLAQLSGLASEESLNLLAFAPELDFRGLLLAAVVIGALGVLDDVTITQVAAVWELRRSDPSMSARQLYAAGIRIGRDHIASTVNTLVLAYTAAALPLLLLFTQSGLGLGDVLTSETVAVEVVQTLVGSIGLVASVPLTTALACWVVTRSATDEDEEDRVPGDRRGRPGSGGHLSPRRDRHDGGVGDLGWPGAPEPVPTGWSGTAEPPAPSGWPDEGGWPERPAHPGPAGRWGRSPRPGSPGRADAPGWPQGARPPERPAPSPELWSPPSPEPLDPDLDPAWPPRRPPTRPHRGTDPPY